MTAETDEQPINFGAATDTRDKTHDHVPFTLEDDGPIYHARRPKMAVMLDLAAAVEDDSQPLKQAAAFRTLIDRVLDPDSAAAINDRLEDDDDDLDLDSGAIQMMFQTLVGLWYRRPTGSPAGSRGSSPRTGKRSTVRKRSQG